jgi:hypothetical protein
MILQNGFKLKCKGSFFEALQSTFSPATFSLHFLVTLLLLLNGCGQSKHVPQALNTVDGLDGSQWEQVSQPGFGDHENTAVVAMAEYTGRLYALVRNDDVGVEVWRTSGTGWEQVSFSPGVTNGVYDNHMINSHMGTLIVFKEKLYCGFSSGIQGSYLRSSGCEIWRYDGIRWESVISDKKDREESGEITDLSGCEDNDGDTTAQVVDSSKSWDENQWVGGILQITSGDGIYRRFDIVRNTADTLTIQQNEIAGNLGEEFTVCAQQYFKNPFPPHDYFLEMVEVGDSYEIGTGSDENGFGDYFNKAIPQMTLFDNKLYVSTVLNYDYGGQVWYTEDGDNWEVTQPEYSLGMFHTDAGYPDGKKPVTRGIPGLGACDVAGTDALYAGCLGSDGNLGGCARMAKLTDEEWELLVHVTVDENDTGTNENGFGDGMDCTMFNGNFNAWSLACFKNRLYVGIQSLAGTRVLYTDTGSPEDGSWFYSAGGDSSLPDGFDGLLNQGVSDSLGETVYQNIAVDLFTYKDFLYAGLGHQFLPAFGATEEYLTGAQIWKTGDGMQWEQVTDNGFDDVTVLNFQAFSTFDDTLYVAASRAANTVGEALGEATVYRLAK